MPATGDPMQRALRDRAAALRAHALPERASNERVSRRGVLIGAAGVGLVSTAPFGSAFATEARATSTRGQRDDPKVVVVGAGLAGLTCAYRLQQSGIAADVYEARRDRVGGRCWTARDFESGQVAEHGGEFIDTRHRQIRRLAHELGLTLEDGRKDAGPVGDYSPIWLDGKLRDPTQIYTGFDDLVRRLTRVNRRIASYRAAEAGAAARAFDEMTAAEWLSDNVESTLLRKAVAISQSGFWGVDVREMSAVNLLEAFVAPYPGADERYHVRGGNDQVPNELARALPKASIRRDSPLTRLRRRADGRYALTFENIRHEVVADKVVLCLPFTALRDVDLADARLSRTRMQSIRELGMGTNSKHLIQLSVRPRDLDDWSGSVTMDAPHDQSSWDSTTTQPGSTSIITVWRGGRSGTRYPTDSPHGPGRPAVLRSDLAAFERAVPGITDAHNGVSWLDSWVDDRWAKGSYAGFFPGQYTRFWGELHRAERGVHFAGEHTSTHSQGYLNGGVESGERAAREVLASVGTRT